MNNQYQEAREIAKQMAPFSRGSFTVGGVAYNPHAVRDRMELEVIAVVPDFKKTDFRAVENALGRRLNPNAVNLASQGQIDVFDTHYKSDGGFDVGVYLRSEEAHKSVCGLGGYKRFTSSKNVPRSCAIKSLDGENAILAESEEVDGGRVYKHYSVIEMDGKLWFGFPATNILMTPTILNGNDFLRDSFRTFERNLKAKLSEKYKKPSINLVRCIPEHLAKMMVSGLRTTLGNYRLID